LNATALAVHNYIVLAVSFQAIKSQFAPVIADDFVLQYVSNIIFLPGAKGSQPLIVN
jgi:hypothetical protein